MEEIMLRSSFNLGLLLGVIIGTLFSCLIFAVSSLPNSKSNKCKNCHNRLLTKDLFCRQCGTKRKVK